ncbi:MAG: DMT family transporter [Acetobacteraceae bacterium]|nr:DMT family transporter [Acetobacteraceae bacterium]MDI3309673.1 DMT family transporter [Acetobacteraceae bacterium]
MSSHAQARPAGLAAGAALPPVAIVTMLLLCAAWGVNMVAVKLGVAGIPPALQAGLRSAIGAVLLWGWCRWRGTGFGDWRRDGTLLPGILAGVLFGLEFLLLYIGVGFTTASRAVVFLYGAPFVVALGAHWLLPDDRLTPAKAAGLVIAFGGLILAFAEGLRQRTGELALLGDALCLLGGVLWGATTVLVKASRLRSAPPTLTLQYQLVVSAALLLLASPLLGEPLAVSLTPVVAASFLYQVAGIAFVSYTAWFWLVSRYSASRLAAFSFLTPIFGVLAGALLLGERLGSLFALAVLLVAAGLWLVNRPAR